MSVTSQHDAFSKHVALTRPIPNPADSHKRRAGQHLFIFIACACCGLILAVDVLGEAVSAFTRPTSAFDWGHILVESVATGLLGVAAYLTHAQMNFLKAAAAKSEEQLHNLRSEFDVVLHERFTKWNLSRSEIDVALLTVRGLSICRIAELRHTQQGTIKAQLSAIFKKAGVSSRTELLAIFMDELLDFGSQPQEKGHLLKVAS